VKSVHDRTPRDEEQPRIVIESVEFPRSSAELRKMLDARGIEYLAAPVRGMPRS
jgi:hypothetical protein